MKVVCIGDSLTYGYGVYRNEAWINLLRDSLNCRIMNRGVNGDTTTGMLSRSYSDVIENNPSHVIIMGGSNDFIKGSENKTVSDNIDELIKEAMQNNIIPIIAVQIPIYKEQAMCKWSLDVDYDDINYKIAKHRQWALSHANKINIKCIDFYRDFFEKSNHDEIGTLYIDGLHPSALGNKIMAKRAIEVFQSFNDNHI